MTRPARYALVVLSFAAVAACGGPAAPVAPSTAPAGLTAQEAAFVAQARAIAPRLAGDDERVAARGANTCDSLRDGRPEVEVVRTAVARFSSGSYAVTAEQAQRLVDAARSTVCAS